MPPSLDNPFRKPPRSKKEAEEISNLLAGKERKGVKEVKDEMVSEDAPVIELSSEEQAIAEKAEVSPWTREQMEKWFEKNYDTTTEEFSDHFEKGENGLWEMKNGISDGRKEINEFPKGLDGRGNDLHLSIENIPDDIDFPINLRTLSLNNVKDPTNLVLPEGLKQVQLNDLKTVEGLDFPDGIWYIEIFKAGGIESVHFPDSVKSVLANISTVSQRERLEKKYPHIAFI